MKYLLMTTLLAVAVFASIAKSIETHSLSSTSQEDAELLNDLQSARAKVRRYMNDDLRRGIYLNELSLLCMRVEERRIARCDVDIKPIQ